MQNIQLKNPIKKEVVALPKIKSIGIIGSCTISYQKAELIGHITEEILEKGYHLASGGAIGVDQFVVERLLRIGRSENCTIYSAWKSYYGFPIKVRAMTRQFKQYGGSIIWGPSSGKEPQSLVRTALLMRNDKLVDACHGIVAFIDTHSRGTIYTIKKAAQKHLTMVVFPFDCELPELPNIKWTPLKCGGYWEGSYKATYLR